MVSSTFCHMKLMAQITPSFLIAPFKQLQLMHQIKIENGDLDYACSVLLVRATCPPAMPISRAERNHLSQYLCITHASEQVLKVCLAFADSPWSILSARHDLLDDLTMLHLSAGKVSKVGPAFNEHWPAA